jgi:glucose-6-phosphate isomerase
MIDLRIDIASLQPWIKESEIKALYNVAGTAYENLLNRSGKGNDFLGWLNLPVTTDSHLISLINQSANQLAKLSEIVVVVGIGGSYLGARAVIGALEHSFASDVNSTNTPRIIYAGHQLSADYMRDLLDLLDKKDYSLIIISKSGTTTEPALAFRILKAHIEKKYGTAAAQKRIVAITDKEKGVLKKLADKEGYEQFVVPDNVGGRYSVLTPVGLLPIAVAGFNIENIILGAREMQEYLIKIKDPEKNPALLYACARNACYKKGFKTEILVNYEPRLFYLTEWWKQLYGESEGKENKGIFPAGVGFTTDLHSMGQYIQEGLRNLFETVLSIDNSNRTLNIPHDIEGADGLNFIAGKGLTEVNHMAELGTMLAHNDGGVPNIRIQIPKIDEQRIGQLIYFFEFACAISGYMLGVNPFDQPGVEAYKNNMFALLGKPGFEEQTTKLKQRIDNSTK